MNFECCSLGNRKCTVFIDTRGFWKVWQSSDEILISTKGKLLHSKRTQLLCRSSVLKPKNWLIKHSIVNIRRYDKNILNKNVSEGFLMSFNNRYRENRSQLILVQKFLGTRFIFIFVHGKIIYFPTMLSVSVA